MQTPQEEPTEQITAGSIPDFEKMNQMYVDGLISEEKYFEFLAKMREVTLRITQYRAYPVEDLEL